MWLLKMLLLWLLLLLLLHELRSRRQSVGLKLPKCLNLCLLHLRIRLCL
jgi:hypothetical protein